MLFDAFFTNIMFMYNKEVFQKCIELSLEHYLGEKGMSVVELRHPLGWLYNEDTSAFSPEEEVAMLEAIQQRFQQKYPGTSVRLIVCALRMIDITTIRSQMETCY